MRLWLEVLGLSLVKDSRTNKPIWINGNNSNCKNRFDHPRFGKSLIFESYNLLHDGAKSPYNCNDCKINKAGSVTSRSSNGGSAARRQFPHI